MQDINEQPLSSNFKGFVVYEYPKSGRYYTVEKGLPREDFDNLKIIYRVEQSTTSPEITFDFFKALYDLLDWLDKQGEDIEIIPSLRLKLIYFEIRQCHLPFKLGSLIGPMIHTGIYVNSEGALEAVNEGMGAIERKRRQRRTMQ